MTITPSIVEITPIALSVGSPIDTSALRYTIFEGAYYKSGVVGAPHTFSFRPLTFVSVSVTDDDGIDLRCLVLCMCN
jgi:hypothetical protein